MQDLLRRSGYRAHHFAIDDDADGDALVVGELQRGGWAGIIVGSFINGQHAELPATETTTAWFTRLLNLIHAHAPAETRIILVRKPSDVVATVERALGAG